MSLKRARAIKLLKMLSNWVPVHADDIFPAKLKFLNLSLCFGDWRFQP